VAADVAKNIVAFLDPPEHTRPKRAIVKAFKNLLRGKQSLVGKAADEAWARIGTSRSIDFVQQFDIPFAVTCTCWIWATRRRRQGS
jgi:cytochrome P450